MADKKPLPWTSKYVREEICAYNYHWCRSHSEWYGVCLYPDTMGTAISYSTWTLGGDCGRMENGMRSKEWFELVSERWRI